MSSDPATELDWQNPDYDGIYRERVRRLRWIRRHRDRLPALHDYYASHPVEWITHWGHTFDPRRVDRGEPALRPMILFPRQVELVDFIAGCVADQDDGVIEKTREVGVSWCAMHLAVHTWLYKPGAVIGCGSYEADRVDVLGVVDSLLEKGRVIIRNLPPEMRPAGLNMGGGGHLLHKRLLNPANGAQIVGEVGDKIGRGGRASFYIVDEYAFLQHHDIVDGSLSSTTNCRIYISTPFGLGPFHAKTQSPAFRQFRFEWRQDPRKSDAWYRTFLRKWGPTITAREVDIDHHASVEDLVVEGPWIEAAQKVRAALAARGVRIAGPSKYRGAAGLDVGGGTAPSVFVARHGPHVAAPVAWKDLHGDTTITGERAMLLARRARCHALYFDAPGVGAGVASALRRVPPEKRELSQVPPEPELDASLGETPAEAAARQIRDAFVLAGEGEAALGGERRVVLPGDPAPEYVRARGINTGVPATATRWPDGRTSREAFKNLKAELWWLTREAFRRTHEAWLWATDQQGGVEHDPADLIFLPNADVEQLKRELALPRYFARPDGRIAIESKDQLKARGVASPDHADALALTFTPAGSVPTARKLEIG